MVRWTVLLLTAALSMPLAPARAQVTTQSAGDVDRRPFSVGERLTYNVRVAKVGRGRAVAEIVGSEKLRGRTVYHTKFKVDGSLLFFKVNDLYESWFDPNTLVSLRYHQDIDEGSYERNRTYEIFPER